ncbi:MAG: hypothetical protein H6568_07855 [Lewinellaceae bacterium]|nr:hypothetical protein [Saprospiraceae bacterium]MCB9312668.1 hypothetical protein [Lewinellaceae bacterium]
MPRVRGIPTIIILVLASIWTSLDAQAALDWEGHGKGFQYLKMVDSIGILELSDCQAIDFILLEDHRDTIKCKIDDNMNPFSGDSTFCIVPLNDNWDSLYIDFRPGYTFYRKEVSPYRSRFSFVRVSYEQWDSWDKQQLRVELNSSGTYTYQKQANSPIRQIQLPSELLDTMQAHINEIQITSMEGNCSLSICDDMNHTFTFVSSSREVYTYSSMAPSWQIKPIQEFLLSIIPGME